MLRSKPGRLAGSRARCFDVQWAGTEVRGGMARRCHRSPRKVAALIGGMAVSGNRRRTMAVEMGADHFAGRTVRAGTAGTHSCVLAPHLKNSLGRNLQGKY